MTGWRIGGLLAAGLVLVLAACGGDGGNTSGQAGGDPTDAPQADATATNAGTGGAVGVMTLGDEEIAIDRLRCFFEEQPRAGLGGVFTHTAQGEGTNAAGEPVVLDLTRARAEDGAVTDEIIVDIGDPASGETVSLGASGTEGLIRFGEASASATEVDVSEFGGEAVTLSFDLACR